jgi:branched-chain amino acid transport system substrate-binding protein
MLARSHAAIVALSLLVAPAIAQVKSPEPPAQAPVRVISLGGLTGAASGASADLMSARELAAQEVNAGGGLADGRRLMLDLVDVGCTGRDAEDAAGIARAAYETSGAMAFLGPVCSDAALAVAGAAIALGAPMISDGATTPKLTALGDDDLVFRTAPSDMAVASALAELALARGYGRMAIAHEPGVWATDLADAFAAAYRAAGGAIAGRAELPAGRDDYRPQMAALAEQGAADALALFAYAGGGDGTPALRAALRLGAWEAVLGADGLLDDAVVEDLGALKLARVTLAAPAPDRGAEAWAHFAAAAEAAGFNPEAPLAAQGYDAAMIMALALVRSRGEGGAKLAAAIREVTDSGALPVVPGNWAVARRAALAGPVRYVGASGAIRFDAAGDTPGVIAGWKASGGAWRAFVLR